MERNDATSDAGASGAKVSGPSPAERKAEAERKAAEEKRLAEEQAAQEAAAQEARPADGAQPVETLVANARSLLGVSPHLARGALAGQTELTVEDARQRVTEFADREEQ